MTDHDVHGCGRIGSRMAVRCAALGLITATAIMSRLTQIGDLLDPQFWIGPIGVGVLGLFVAAAFLGKKTGAFVCERGDTTSLTVAGGLFVAFGSITIAVFVGSFCTLIAIACGPGLSSHDVFTYLIVPQIVVGMFGSLPATALAVLYGFLLRSGLRKLRT